jgi:hypothetical protein
MAAASAVNLTTAPEAANRTPDPRRVVTPLDPGRAEELLCRYGIISAWKHVIAGLREGFDVGIREQLTCSYIFRKSHLNSARPGLYNLVYSERASCWTILSTIPPRGSRASHRTISHIPPRPSAKTSHRHIQDDSGHVLPSEHSRSYISQPWYQLRRLPDSMGFLRCSISINPISASRMPGSNIRHFRCLSFNTNSPRSAASPVRAMGRSCVCRPSRHVWALIQCRRLRQHRRYACRYLPQSRIYGTAQVGGRFLCHSFTRPVLDRAGIHGFDRLFWSTMEHQENETVSSSAALHRFRLESRFSHRCSPTREAIQGFIYPEQMACCERVVFCTGCSKFARKASSCILHLSSHPTFPTEHLRLRSQLHLTPVSASCPSCSTCRPLVGTISFQAPSQRNSPSTIYPSGYTVVGRCQHILRHRHCHQLLLGSMEMGPRFHGWPPPGTRHRVGRGRSSGTWPTSRAQFRPTRRCQPARPHIPGSLRQCWNCFSNQQGEVTQPRNKQNPQARIPSTSAASNPLEIGICHEPRQHRRRSFMWSHRGIPHWFSLCQHASFNSTTRSPSRQIDIIVALASTTSGSLPAFQSVSSPDLPLQLNSSPLRPHCHADERIFLWKGVHTAPASTINNPTIQLIAALATRASLRDTSSYGSGLRKFHLFCDIFTIPESDRLPASFPLLHSFALWAVTDPSMLDLSPANGVWFEPVSVTVVRKYLSAIRAWHIAQGWPPPLSDEDHERINWSLRGLGNILGNRKRPIRPPITIDMLRALRATLKLDNPFEACIWAMVTCAFWGMMRFGEVSVTTRNAFDKSKHLTRRDVHLGTDLDGKPYARLDLPSAKTAKPGEIQSVFMVPQEGLCPIDALKNLATIVPAGPEDPLFSWRDQHGNIRPMVKSKAISHINVILKSWGWGTAFGHSFRIGGASFYLAQKVDPEIVRIAGRWRSLAYETYIRAFEQVASRHLGGLLSQSSG